MDTVDQESGFDKRFAAEDNIAERVTALERRFHIFATKQDEVFANSGRASLISEKLDKDLSPVGRSTLSCCMGTMCILIVLTYIMSSVLTPKRPLNRYIYGPEGRKTDCRPVAGKDEIWEDWFSITGRNNESEKVLNESRHVYIDAAVMGLLRSNTMQSSILTIVGYFCISLAALVPTVIVSIRPEAMHRDFENKGTLSNLCQDVACPHGRVFTTMLFTGSLLMMLSAYPQSIYMSWFPLAQNKYEFLFLVFQGHSEKIARTAWATLPNVGLMLTAALPSLTDNRGLNMVLTIIHTVAAPSSLIMLSVMETTQLSYGENAFTYFFCSDENSSWNGRLRWSQRVRVMMVCYLWIIICLFFSMQAYLYSRYVGVQTKPSYTFALKSLYCEISALLLAYGLPAFQASKFVHKHLYSGMESIFVTAAATQLLPPPGIAIPEGKPSSSLLEVANLANISMRAVHHTKFGKHLSAAADGLSLF